MNFAVPTITVLVKSYLGVKSLFLLDSRRIRQISAVKKTKKRGTEARFPKPKKI